MRVRMRVNRLDGFYQVCSEPGHGHYKEFWWGMFDDGDISWQSARSQALKYANQLAEKLGCKVER